MGGWKKGGHPGTKETYRREMAIVPQDLKTGSSPENGLTIYNLNLSFSLYLSHLCLSQDTLSALLTASSPVVTTQTKKHPLNLAVVIRTLNYTG